MSAVEKKTRVVSMLLAPYNIYIGRGDKRVGTPDSDWANPYHIGKDGTREEVCEKFKEYIYSRPDLLRRIESLKGQTLGCACKPGDIEAGLCHGVTLAGLANGDLPMPELPEFEGWDDDKSEPPVSTAIEMPVTVTVQVFEVSKNGKAVKPRRKKAIKGTVLLEPKVTKALYPADFIGLEPPKQLWKSRRIGSLEYKLRNDKVVKGKLHLAGRGCTENALTTANVMFISPCALMEEEWSNYSSEPMLLKGAPANLFLRCIRRAGFKDGDWWYTTLCKYNVPRMKPKAEDLRWNQAMLDDEILTIKPKLIICLGKTPFDHLSKLKFKLKDIQGGFFRSEKYNCLLYPMDTMVTPLLKPEYLERFMTDLKQAKRQMDELNGVVVDKVETDYRVVENKGQLTEFVADLASRQAEGRLPFLTVDCEWAGQTAWGGLLRSLQISRKAGVGVYIKLRDEDGNYTMDIPVNEVGNILRPVLSNPVTGLVGHNFAADGVWLEEHLDIHTAGRCVFDTMFAQQVLNEYSDLKLERLAVGMTDLGRYDIELLMWKKATGFDDDDNEGYGKVPDKIIIPYGQRDVDATMRIFPILRRKLVEQGLWQYYQEIALPFVTDVFIELMRTGLPINREYLDEMRITFARNRDWLIADFRKALRAEANKLLLLALCEIDRTAGVELFQDLMGLLRRDPKQETGEYNFALGLFKNFVGPEKLNALMPLFDHWVEADQFNVNSTEHLKRWLFDVKKFQPLKTTKKDGIAMAWERVKTLPLDRQADFSPAADKQTIKVLAARDSMVARVEEMKSVMNIVKAFLKEKDDKGREQGLHKWIQMDERVHANFAVTETGRPRAWRPNIFNWPKAIAKPIEKAFERINKAVAEDMATTHHQEPTVEREYEALMHKPVSLRSAVQAPEGWVFVDMDFKTAEVVALAHVAGDENMINVLTEPDVQFGRIDKGDPKKSLRLLYNENEGIPEDKRDPKLIADPSDPRFLRDEAGNIIHPRRDLHWELGAAVAGSPRELLDEELFRGVGKIGNFSIPYGSAETNLERLVEASTGRKPPEGTGLQMIQAYKTKYPVASRFLDAMSQVPSQGDGTYRSISGRVRHFFYNELGDVEGLSDYSRNGILNPLTRQGRNFPIQELVAATLAKALKYFVRERNAANKKAGLMMALYDAAVVLCPLEELKWAQETLKDCMTRRVPWTIHGRTFTFDVDISIAFKWGVKLTKEEKEIVAPYLK